MQFTSMPTARFFVFVFCAYFGSPTPALAQSGGWTTTTATSSGWDSSTGPSCTGVKPTLSSGQTWVANPGCTNGGTYNTASNQRCRCWSHCGYICGSSTTPAPGWGTPTPAPGWGTPTTQGWTTAPPTQGWTTTKPTQGWTTAKPTQGWTTAKPTQGWTTAKPTQGWTTTQGWTAAPTTTGWGSGSTSSPCTNVRPILSSGQTWVPNPGCTNGPTFNNAGTHCHCWSHCGYICGAKTTTPGWTSG